MRSWPPDLLQNISSDAGGAAGHGKGSTGVPIGGRLHRENPANEEAPSVSTHEQIVIVGASLAGASAAAALRTEGFSGTRLADASVPLDAV